MALDAPATRSAVGGSVRGGDGQTDIQDYPLKEETNRMKIAEGLSRVKALKGRLSRLFSLAAANLYYVEGETREARRTAASAGGIDSLPSGTSLWVF